MNVRAGGNRGVALVITLILLAVITTLAIAFLALTSRETGAVDAMGRTTDAELAAESALERAKAQIVAPFPFFNQGTNFGSEIMGPDFTVSVAWDTNRMDFTSTGFNDLTNLFRDPSPPVFVDTNRYGTTGPGEDRFYLDLNRNFMFEQTGHVPVTTDNPANNGWGFDFEFQGGQILTNWQVGDPQWIGVLQDPSRPHGPDNRFIARYAFLIQPIGRSLDVNWMHNQVLENAYPVLDMRRRNGFYRNQGVGTWELNLAGFLADLNANAWSPFVGNAINPTPLPYLFDPWNTVPTAIATGYAFDDAAELLRYRYSPWNYGTVEWNLANPPGSPEGYIESVDSLLPGLGGVVENDMIDSYGDGPFSFGPIQELPADVLADKSFRRWPASDGKRHFSSLHDFVDGRKLPAPGPGVSGGFVNRLSLASARGNSYDRYTYYRMLAQLGIDSIEEDEDAGKININYVNVGGVRATELIPWSDFNTVSNRTGRFGPELFFISAATNMFAREPALAFIVTNEFFPGTGVQVPLGTPLTIPVFTNGAMGIAGVWSTMTTNAPYQRPGEPGPLYSGRIHQILQLAANIHVATKTNELPDVFRPQFMRLPNGDVYITNYVLAGPASTIISSNQPWVDLDLGGVLSNPNTLVYGIPFIIGARKGIPSFNEFAMHSEVRVVRRLSIRRDANTRELVETNQQLEISITNRFFAEARNGYAAAYPRELRLSLGIRPTYTVTNSASMTPLALAAANPIAGRLQINPNTWRKANEYLAPVLTETNQLVMRWVTNSPPDPGGFTNLWAMTVTNHLLFYLTEPVADRIVDAVTLNGPRTHFEIGRELARPTDSGKQLLRNIWSSEKDAGAGTSVGVRNQIAVSQLPTYTDATEWDNYSVEAKNKDGGIQAFITWLTDRDNTNLVKQVPFTPVRVIIQTNFFEVNDPFVHYTMEDLHPTSSAYTAPKRSEEAPPFKPERNPKSITWNNGDFSDSAETPGRGSVNPTLRDPGVTTLDRWDFPTSTFASVGWLGRVHRGTPWQTIYLKSSGPTEDWRDHSGPARTAVSADAIRPTRDWELVDAFTASIHPNAARGRLSVNQTNLAAWSAVLSGVVVGRSINDEDLGAITATNHVIDPVALDARLMTIVEGINRTRTNAPVGRQSGQFSRMGDILATPELTFRSPFLNNSEFDAEAPSGIGQQIFDADYERIPQQILSLLKRGEPRFVVYTWGQSLKPARNGVLEDGTLRGPSIVTAGADKGLCINYQITGETATKSIIRVDFDPLPNDFRPDYRRPHAVVESFNVVPTD